jgi:phosphoglycerate dehydrogenase-like enzyme
MKGDTNMEKKYTIVFCFNPAYVPQEVIDVAQRSLPDGFELIAIERDYPLEEKLEIYEKADFLMEFSADPTPEEFEALKKVRLIQLLSAGYNKFNMLIANQKKIPVANNHGNCIAVAEFILLLILALLRKLPVHHNTTKDGRWLEHNLMVEMGELAGRTAGIIGMGFVGREVARRIRSFDANVIYTDILRRAGREVRSPGGPSKRGRYHHSESCLNASIKKSYRPRRVRNDEKNGPFDQHGQGWSCGPGRIL